jgi:outer membrane protein assembly factor BamA
VFFFIILIAVWYASRISARCFRARITEKITAVLFGLCFATLVLADTQSRQSEKTRSPEDNQKCRVEVKEKSPGISFRKVIGFPLKIAFSPFYLVDHGLKKGLLSIEKRNMVPRISYLLSLPGSRGIYGIFGELGSGSGLGGGIGVSDTGLFGSHLRTSVSAAISLNLYQEYKASLESSSFSRFTCISNARYSLKHEEIFYGIGPETDRSDTSFWGMEEALVHLGLRDSPGEGVTISGNVKYQNIRIHTEEDASEWIRDPYHLLPTQLLFSGASVKRDTRDEPGDPFSGGIEYLSFGVWRDIANDRVRFFDYTSEIVRYFTLFKEGRKISIRLLCKGVKQVYGYRTPFFSMPRLGGFTTLRGYPEDRFRDTQAVCANLEYSYPIWRRSVDAVVFADMGQVFHRFSDIGFSTLATSYGGGIRLKSPGKPIFGVEILRLEIARSAEGFRVMASVSPPFERQ